MNDPSKRLERIEQLFHEAADLPPAQRSGFLEEQCRGDDALLQEVERLFRPVPSSIGQYLESPPTPESSSPPERIGPYRVLRLLGEGGMAVVYLAEQTEPVRRTVAVKLIKPGCDSQDVLRRFEAERQALALMEHPSVAKVFDAGTTETGRPYFVLEFVDGLLITEYCDRESIDLERRLELFVGVCDAVQHAHQKGILHRDLKPSNILVTSKTDPPQLKVIDFGVAKAVNRDLIDETLVTSFGQFIGTPEYMSPEQAASSADIDTRSDVYSLGVLLYELLVSELPFSSQTLRQGGLEEMLRVIREQEPQRPSEMLDSPAGSGIGRSRRTQLRALQRRIQGELDWIVMKAMDKDRSRRYASPSDLARDVTRHLNHEPVLAGPPTTGYRLRKFVRRHRVPVFAGTVVLVVLVGALAVSLRFGLSEARQRQLVARSAERLQTVVEFQTSMLEENPPEGLGLGILAHLRRIVREGLGRSGASDGEIDAALDDFDRVVQAANPADLGNAVVGKEILGRAAAAIDETSGDDPLLEAELRVAVGRTYDELGLHEEAVAELSRAVELRRRHAGREHEETLSSMLDLGTALGRMDRFEDAEACLGEVLEICRRTLGTDHRDTRTALHMLGKVVGRTTDHGRAEALLREAYELQRTAAGDDDVMTHEFGFALGAHLHRIGKVQEAVEWIERTVREYGRLRGEDDPSTLEATSELADLYRKVGRLEEASRLQQQACAGLRRTLGEDHPLTLVAARTLGRLLSATGKHEEAVTILEDVVRRSTNVLGERNGHTVSAQIVLGCVLAEAGRHADAESRFRSILDLLPREPDENDLQLLGVLTNLPLLLLEMGRMAESEALARQALATFERILGHDHRLTLEAQERVAEVLMRTGRAQAAEPMLRDALERRRAGYGEEHARTLATAVNLVNTLGLNGKLSEAVSLGRETLAGLERTYGTEDPLTADCMNILGRQVWRMGEFREAGRLQLEALDVCRRVRGADHPRTISNMSDTAVALVSLREFDRAEELYRESIERQEQGDGGLSLLVIAPRINLALLILKRGRFEEARVELDQAVRDSSKALGKKHQATLTARIGLAQAFVGLGRTADGAEEYRQVLASQRRQFGENHPATLQTMSLLGEVLLMLGLHEEARPLIDHALARRRRLFGADHAETLIGLRLSAMERLLAGDIDEAHSRCERVLEGLRRAPKDPSNEAAIIRTVLMMAEILREMEEPTRALALQREALDGFRRIDGETAISTLEARIALAKTLTEVGDPEAGTQQAEEAVEQLRALLTASHPILIDALHAHAHGLTKLGRHDEAEALLIEARTFLQEFPNGPLDSDNCRGFAALFEARHAVDPSAGHDREARMWIERIPSRSDSE